MSLLNRKEPLVLLLGDLFFFLVSLWLTLLLRYATPPSDTVFFTHLAPFSILFAVWILVFYIAGLYEKHTTILTSRLPNILGVTQITNSGIAVIFFYFVPLFVITPKTILFIYLIISFGLILFWRTYGYFALGKRVPNNAILIGSGEEMKNLLTEVNGNPIYNLTFVYSVDLNRSDEEGFWKEIVSKVYSEDVSVIAIDLANENVGPMLPHLYNLIFSKVNFIDMHKIYEDIFYKVPLSLLNHNWFLENISTAPRSAYDGFKRVMDIAVSIPLLVVPAVMYPILSILMKFEDGGPVFISQERIGQNNRRVKIWKFRSMIKNDSGEYEKGNENKVTRLGRFLRKSRLDEFPQLWSVLKGDLSLIGPRPELPILAEHYAKEIPYYNVRHLIKPGLGGWAQIYGEHGHGKVAVDETKNKLSYDLYYIKNRSALVDLKIALRTLKTLAIFAGK